MLGIYAYFDKKDNSVAYVGKDSNIEINKRHRQHHQPCMYHQQKINQILQNNPNCYTYQVLVWNVKDQETLNALEIQHIRQLKPKFNFTEGGDGMLGFKHSEESKKKMSESGKGFKHSKEHKKMISEKLKGVAKSKKHCENISKAKKGEKNPMYGKIWKDNPQSIYTLWNTGKCHYDKNVMFRNNREPNPIKCFRFKYDGFYPLIGGFIDFTSVNIIYDIVENESHKEVNA